MYFHTPKLVKNSQKLRKNMTPEEKHLWYDFLKLLPVTVKRQKIIENYILDFYVPSVKIAIELDGIQHGFDENKKSDDERDNFLRSKGIVVLRYSNKDINFDFNNVCRDILGRLGLSKLDTVEISTSSTASGPPSPLSGKADRQPRNN